MSHSLAYEHPLRSRVIFVPCDRVKARVIGVCLDIDGLRYRVRYFHAGVEQIAYAFPEELEKDTDT